jgi:dihydrofolate reductase (trimethoprim resistance protein)
MGDLVSKRRGSSWHGRIVGWYSTQLTPEGYCVESDREPGSVQIYPAAALMEANPNASLVGNCLFVQV